MKFYRSFWQIFIVSYLADFSYKMVLETKKLCSQLAGYHLHTLIKTTIHPRRIQSFWASRYGRNQVKNYEKGLRGSDYVTKYIGKEWTELDIK
ncbi:MAG: hypothetical protein IIA45_07465 [Bacteroidetes bacterium]|nr:hypothetical protein [Bacteroidota bacterium]